MEHNHIMEIEDANKNIMRITPLGKISQEETSSKSLSFLGAGQEVGRSCVVLEYLGKTIMVKSCLFLQVTLFFAV